MIAVAYKLARGVRLRRDGDGNAMLLVPEGIVALNEPAAAALELANGKRTLEQIADELGERFDDPDGTLREDVLTLLAELADAGFVTR